MLSPVLELLALLAADLAGAPVVAPATPPPSPRLPAVRTAVAPVIDGKLDDETWKAAVPTDKFTQQTPFEGRPPSEKTTLRILYDDDSLYVSFDAEHRQTPIIKRLTRRDQDSESDWVWVQLDTRRNGKSAFMFAINVSGVLADQTIYDQSVVSTTWDENWEGRTALTATGWSAELRIPLRVLRFASSLPVQSWGLQAVRYLPAKGEYVQWALTPRTVSDYVARYGRLDDLRDLKQGGRLELRPFATGRVRRQDAGTDTLAQGYDAAGSAGLDLKWHVAQDLTLDAAFNPEFGQVEADQVILNLTNYETFLPEKRPLFLEGVGAFSTVRENAYILWESETFPDRLFYSRRIGSAPAPPSLGADEALVDVPVAATIYAAAKLTGQLTSRWTIGALSALTAENRVTTQTLSAGVRTSRVVDPATAFNVLRLKREIGDGHLGFIATGASRFDDTAVGGTCAVGQPAAPDGRCFHDAYAGGIDGLARFGSGHYTAAAQVVGSQIHGGPTRTVADGTTIQAGDRGLGGWARLAKEGGEHVIWSLEYAGQSRRIDYNDVGYMARQNLHELKAGVEYRTLKPGALTLETHTRLEGSSRRNLDGVNLGHLLFGEYSLLLHNFWRYTATAGGSPARFDDRELGDRGGLGPGQTAALERSGYAFGRAEVQSDIRARVTGEFGAEAHVHRGGYGFEGEGKFTVHALPQLELALEPQVTFTTGEPRFAGNAGASHVFGRLLAKSASAILRVSYTFTPRLSLQTYAQLFLASGHYSDLRALPQSPSALIRLGDIDAAPPAMTTAGAVDFEQAALNANVVLRWEYRLGSSLFIVYSRSQAPTVQTFQAPATLRLSALNHGAAADVVLLKLSYWWGS